MVSGILPFYFLSYRFIQPDFFFNFQFCLRLNVVFGVNDNGDLLLCFDVSFRAEVTVKVD